MHKSDSLQGSLDLLVLKILSPRLRHHVRDSEHVWRSASRRGGFALSRATSNGGNWLDSRQVDHQGTGRRARIYELTAAGKKQLALEESRWLAITSAVNRVLRTV
jgi:PadR family transcriptional regulator PadR